MSALIIPFPAGLQAAAISGRLQDARLMPALAPTAERRAYITGYLDCMLRQMADEPAVPPASRRKK